MDWRIIFEEIKRGYMSFFQNISALTNFCLLSIVYLIGIGLTSITLKIFGNKILELKLDKGLKSYWSDSDLKKKTMEEYYKQF